MNPYEIDKMDDGGAPGFGSSSVVAPSDLGSGSWVYGIWLIVKDQAVEPVLYSSTAT